MESLTSTAEGFSLRESSAGDLEGKGRGDCLLSGGASFGAEVDYKIVWKLRSMPPKEILSGKSYS